MAKKQLFDVRVLVLIGASGGIVWLAIVRPAVATAIGLGLTVLYVMHRLVDR
jgi:hypothetical protein